VEDRENAQAKSTVIPNGEENDAFVPIPSALPEFTDPATMLVTQFEPTGAILRIVFW